MDTILKTGLAIYPANTRLEFKWLPNVITLKIHGDNGFVSEFVDIILSNQEAR